MSTSRKSGQMLLWVFCGVFALCSVGRAGAQSEADEYQVKAAFLFHFAQLVQWPPESLPDPQRGFTICTFGDDPFEGQLEGSLEGKKIDSRTMRVLHVNQIEDAPNCQIVFIGKNQKKRIPGLLVSLSSMPVVTVGETADFVQQGGIIRLTLEENRVRFEINRSAAERSNLKISSRLLLLAKNVVGGPATR